MGSCLDCASLQLRSLSGWVLGGMRLCRGVFKGEGAQKPYKTVTEAEKIIVGDVRGVFAGVACITRVDACSVCVFCVLGLSGLRVNSSLLCQCCGVFPAVWGCVEHFVSRWCAQNESNLVSIGYNRAFS